MLVSSRHMILGSPIFKAMLQPSNFKEGRELSASGKVEVGLPDDDANAFRIVLDIIHDHNRRVPKQISLELITRISTLVDKYQMVEAVEPFSDVWIEGLRSGLPTAYGSDSKENVHQWIVAPAFWKSEGVQGNDQTR
jgi:hypothetical protein